MSSTDIATDSDHVAPIASNLQKGGRKTLEEDDEFEDFPLDTWSSEETLREAVSRQENLWEEDWDDVEVEDEFTRDLKAELEKNKQSQ